MRIGIPRETKEGERRVALLPDHVAILAAEDHAVTVQLQAGAAIGRGDDEYFARGAFIGTASQVWACDLIVKVKEMLPEDFRFLQPNRAIFCFHQLPSEPERTRSLAERQATAIAFEMVRDARGGFPLLAPMSVISGRMAVEAVLRHLPARDGRALVLGAGNAGMSAARTAREHGLAVTILTRSEGSRDAARADGFAAALATPEAIEREAFAADLVVGAVLVPGQPTPKLLPRELVRRMKRGAVIADISIDAGGVAGTSRPTTHAEPTFVDEGVVHYCVSNIPGADPAAATTALSTALLPFVMELAGHGIARAVRANAGLRAGVLLWKGHACHPGIAQSAGLPYTPLSDQDLA
jgi:alanine dehydrogenase